MFVHRNQEEDYLNYTIWRNTCGSSEVSVPEDNLRYWVVVNGFSGEPLVPISVWCGIKSLDAGYFSLQVMTFHLETVFVLKSCTNKCFHHHYCGHRLYQVFNCILNHSLFRPVIVITYHTPSLMLNTSLFIVVILANIVWY
jgi:hypothetical protein